MFTSYQIVFLLLQD